MPASIRRECDGGTGGELTEGRRQGGAARHECDDAHRYASVPFSSEERPHESGMDVGGTANVGRKRVSDGCAMCVAIVHDRGIEHDGQ
jgi:hypothetical protein